ncbi:MAG: lysophospholipid acyltransferase family protein [Chloroflexota bacterium]|nr:lysophospholipid acyltransferase family protein [Chloroflexota bacterium]
MSKLYKICDLGLRFTFFLFGDLKIVGFKNIPRNKPIITVSNHLSIIDPPLCASAVGKDPKFLAKKELFKFPANILLKFYGAFPINRSKLDISAINWAKDQLKDQNNSLLIFPEGTRSKNLKLQKGFNGAARIAIDTDSIILPVSISGSEKCTNYFQFLFPKMSINIKIGEPFKIKSLPKNRNKELYDHITKEIMHRISILLPEKYTNNSSDFIKEFKYTEAL